MKIEEQYNHAKDRLNGRLFAPYQMEGVLYLLTMENQTSENKNCRQADPPEVEDGT